MKLSIRASTLIRYLRAAGGLAALLATAAAQLPLTPSPVEQRLRIFLQRYLEEPGLKRDRTTRYYPAFASLTDDRTQEVVVYITGQSWCGSGGCTTLILAPRGSSFMVVTRVTITRPPIRILDSKSNGWHDIAVRVQGGGIRPGYDAELSFDGKTYPCNPSFAPAKPLHQEGAGRVLVSLESQGALLYN
jgi:hypothetical protein